MNIPKEYKQALTAIVELTEAFCEKNLNEDYRQLCEDMAARLYAGGLPINKGRPASWASGIVHAFGWVNFLGDPSRKPYMTTNELAAGFGVSVGTMMAKSRIIRDELELIQLDPDWCLPSLLKDNPLVWMLEVNGFIMDIRMAPRELQEEAYRLGLIPFIPADEQESGPEVDKEAKIIKFPAGQNKTSKQRAAQKSEDDGPDLLEELEE
jgi:hypothetical protein